MSERDLSEILKIAKQIQSDESRQNIGTELAIHVIERAIKAEAGVKRLEDLVIKTQSKYSYLKEENDIQRASIQELSAKLAKMQRVVETVRTAVISCDNHQTWCMDDMRQALSELEQEGEK